MAEAEMMDFIVEEACIGQRLDVFLADKSGLTRSQVQKLIEEQMVDVNGKKLKANYKVKYNDLIKLTKPELKEIEALPEEIPLEVLYEDNDIVVINKPQGMVVHPACGNYSGTMVNALLAHCDDLSGIGGEIRPGIVHRLDKDTSGAIVVAKNDLAHLSLTQQIKDKTVLKKYNAIVYGNIREDKGEIEAPIGRHPVDRKRMAVVDSGGRNAVSLWEVKERFGKFTFVEVTILTGRTHQIRVHFAYIGHPVLGDPVYGSRKTDFNLKGQVLHARTLGLRHPRTGEYMEFNAPLPESFENVLMNLRQKWGTNPN